MNFGWNEEQKALAQSARKFLEAHSSCQDNLTIMQTEHGYHPETWQTLCTEMGWTGLTIPEAYGGFGLTYPFLIALMEEMGRYLFASPFFSSICLGANALLLGGSESQKASYLPLIASGQKRATLAYLEDDKTATCTQITTIATPKSGGYILNGAKSFVLDGHTADIIILSAMSNDGMRLFIVDAKAPGVSTEYTPTMDQTRKQATLYFKDVALKAEDQLGSSQNASKLLEKILDLGCVALAAEQLGGAERCLETSVEYAKNRIQFGRPIGSFQAIKHTCADMLLQVESARSAAYYAGWAASENSTELSLAAAQAKSYCSEAFFFCAAQNIQIHGGIGFTWEHEAHLYFKRAQGSQILLGSPQHHRKRIATALGLGVGEN